MMIIFGEITGNIVEYAKLVSNSTNETYIWGRNEILIDQATDFAIKVIIIGIITITTSYISSLLFNFSAIRQVRLFFDKLLKQRNSSYCSYQLPRCSIKNTLIN